MPADLDQFRWEYSHGAVIGREGLVGPTAPAIADAVYNATGYQCMDMPITPEKVLKGIKNK